MEDPLVFEMQFHPGPTSGFDSIIAICPTALFVPLNELGGEEALDMRLAVGFLTKLAQDGAAPVREVCAKAQFTITRKAELIRTRGLMHDCAECRAAVDQALAHNRDHPETRYIIGQLYWLDLETES